MFVDQHTDMRGLSGDDFDCLIANQYILYEQLFYLSNASWYVLLLERFIFFCRLIDTNKNTILRNVYISIHSDLLIALHFI